MNFLKHNWILLLIIGILIVCITALLPNSELNETKVVKSFYKTDISRAEQITCTYHQILSTSYLSNEISHTLNKPEKNPLIFSFSKYKNEKGGVLSYLDSTQTITNVPLVKLLENDEKIIFIDGDAENYLSIHTIYKKEGVSSYAKNVNILGIPMGSLGMGSCVGY